MNTHTPMRDTTTCTSEANTACVALFDIGANLTHRALLPHIEYLLTCAYTHNIRDICITAAHPDNTQLALASIESHKKNSTNQNSQHIRLTTTCGLHPHLAHQYTPDMDEQITQFACTPEVVAIGETGLDYFRMISPATKQRASFCAHLDLAARLQKPVFLHQRDAHADFIAILREFRASLHNIVVHCFTDNGDALEDYLQLGCSIGITGWICDPKRGMQLRDIVRYIPDNCLMIETDAPYLLPPIAKKQSKTSKIPRHNLPHYLPFVVETLAQCRQQSFQHIATHSYNNASAFFYNADSLL